MNDMPALRPELLRQPEFDRLESSERATHPPRILLLYGSLRERSFSRLLVEEAARLLQAMGAETRIFDPRELPVTDSVPATHPKVAELRELSLWSEGQVWCSPERHGAITSVFKNQIDWLPLERVPRAEQARHELGREITGEAAAHQATLSRLPSAGHRLLARHLTAHERHDRTVGPVGLAARRPDRDVHRLGGVRADQRPSM